MTTHHCKTYPRDPYCNCYGPGGEHKYHYKQFDTESQTYNCCDSINASLMQLRQIPATEGDSLPNNVRQFFDTLSSKSFSGCCYDPYFINPNTGNSDTEYFIKNYENLYNEYNVSKSLYSQFIEGTTKPIPTMSSNNVTCSDNQVPFILSYRYPGQTYYNYSYFCSTNTNDSFQSITVGGEEIDFRVSRFYDNSSGQPCISPSCQLITNDSSLNNFGDIVNQGNHQPVYNNKSSKNQGGFIASGVLAILLFLVGIYVFYKIHKKLDELEKNRVN